MRQDFLNAKETIAAATLALMAQSSNAAFITFEDYADPNNTVQIFNSVAESGVKVTATTPAPDGLQFSIVNSNVLPYTGSGALVAYGESYTFTSETPGESIGIFSLDIAQNDSRREDPFMSVFAQTTDGNSISGTIGLLRDDINALNNYGLNSILLGNTNYSDITLSFDRFTQIDNVEFSLEGPTPSPVPLPGGLPLMASAIAALWGFRQLNRN